jgi:hypothetical protein
VVADVGRPAHHNALAAHVEDVENARAERERGRAQGAGRAAAAGYDTPVPP